MDANTTSYDAPTLLRRVNNAYIETVGKIIGLDGRWQFDDSNFTSLPIGTTDLVAAQKDYSFDSTQLDIERVEVKDQSGIWHLLRPIDKSDIGVALAEFEKADGLPYCYDKNGSSVFLYPGPATGSVSLTAGLKVYFQRTASIFTSGEVSTGTKEPGFASPYHVLLAYKAALPFAMKYRKDRVQLLLIEIARLEKEMLAFYARREKDERTIMTTAGISFR